LALAFDFFGRFSGGRNFANFALLEKVKIKSKKAKSRAFF